MELWLDLELRADIDDYITLLYAIETNKNITELSIVNPSINELKLFKYVKEKYNLNIPIIYSGKIIDLLGNKGIDHNLLDLIQYIELDFDNDIIHINDYLKQNINFENKIVFCGGAFTNLKMILEQNPLQNIIGYLQGGYAGETIVGKENVLEKFKGREQVPSWNPNLDLESTNYILNSNNLENILNEPTQAPIIENIDYKTETEAFISQNQEINSSNQNEFYTLLSLAIHDKNIQVMDSLYKLDNEYKNDENLLELKFTSYAEALNISKDDVYSKMLEKYFSLDNDEIKSIDNLEKTFDTYFELSSIEKENLSPEDLKHQLYIETLTELTVQEYEQYMWKEFDMDNENISEDNMKAYLEATQNLYEESTKLNELISESLEVKQLQNQIENFLENGNLKQAQELIQDERLEHTTRNFFEYIYESMLSDDKILDEVYEKIVTNLDLEEKTYEAFKGDTFLEEMKKIDIEERLIDEIFNEMKQEELEEYEKTLGGE